VRKRRGKKKEEEDAYRGLRVCGRGVTHWNGCQGAAGAHKVTLYPGLLGTACAVWVGAGAPASLADPILLLLLLLLSAGPVLLLSLLLGWGALVLPTSGRWWGAGGAVGVAATGRHSAHGLRPEF